MSKKIKNKAVAQNELKVSPKKQSIIETEPVKNKAHSSSHNKKNLHKKDFKYSIKASIHGITPRMINRNALTVVEKLQRQGYEAYVVGGCLRDLLLGKKPKDFDVATNARPEQIQAIFQRQCRLVGRRFRLAHIMFGREIIEVATFRANHAESHNEKHAKQSEEGMLLRDNVYGTLEQDAERRDFSVNALYYNPQDNILKDFFNGIEDLKNGKLRLIGDPVTRYQEDPVRMLRSIRFMAKLDMFLDKPSEIPIKDLAHLLKNIPPARLFEESLKLLQTGHGVKTYRLLRQYGLFELLFPLLSKYFTAHEDSMTEKMILRSLTSTDERVVDKLPLNPAFLFAAFFWYPLRERVEVLKNEGGLNNHDAYALASNDVLELLCNSLAVPRRHTTVIRDIWSLQLQFLKRTQKSVQRAMEQTKFRAGFDLLAMRAEIEGGETVDLATWWHEYQFSNDAQRQNLMNALPNQPKRKYHRRKRNGSSKKAIHE